ncbi:heavy metal translocating P-type ATPase [Chroococcidiopsis sp. CCMEE 29]|uniref:heavy metal translocating P-type ATPase n=1 Tax=Chroococcidiopsis sp. CCMEE 29 TaxID=155894 RepID=UPI002020E10B|nr:heavy metal translocating P-type ATPase [Chroococcidiopsis sp. CCMEE 29]
MDHQHSHHKDHEHHGHHTSARSDNAGHDKHAGHSPEMFKRRFFISLILTLPILYLDPHFQEWFGYQAVQFPGSDWVSPILSVVLYFYGGWVFIEGAWRELRSRIGMMTLIALAITVAFIYSLAVSLGLQGMPFYWELATLIDIMLLGHWIEMVSVQGASRALENLAELLPATAHRMVGDRLEDVPINKLAVGDRILIRPGEQIPIDGEVIDGTSSVNEAFLTGESRPVLKQVGDEVVAGAVNSEGALSVQVTRTGDRTTLSQIMRLVEEAQTSRSRYQVLADKIAYWLTLIAISVGTLTFVIWLAVGDGLVFAINRAVTVLVITCPHALGLAIPLVIVNATSMSAKNGILVRNREAFERARNIKTIAFDKTGTLTEGKFGVQRIHAETMEEMEALAIAAALESFSEHPLAQAIVQEAAARRLTIPQASDFKSVTGKGVESIVNGKRYRVGRSEWALELGLKQTLGLQTSLEQIESRGESAIALLDDTRVLALFGLADRVREQAREAVQQLHAMAVQVVMITGDAEAVAKTVAADLGIDRYYARVLPQDKAAIVTRLKTKQPTAFVGDGINDAPALSAADLGLAIGAGTNVAIESADLVLVENDPLDATYALKLAKATYNKMIQNLFWATGYNVVAIPLAAGIAYPLGFVLSPAVGAVLMSLSTVIVSINAVLLRRVKLA